MFYFDLFMLRNPFKNRGKCQITPALSLAEGLTLVVWRWVVLS